MFCSDGDTDCAITGLIRFNDICDGTNGRGGVPGLLLPLLSNATFWWRRSIRLFDRSAACVAWTPVLRATIKRDLGPRKRRIPIEIRGQINNRQTYRFVFLCAVRIHISYPLWLSVKERFV